MIPWVTVSKEEELEQEYTRDLDFALFMVESGRVEITGEKGTA